MALILVLACFLLASSSSVASYDKAIFLLAGQSNMAGRGGTYTPTQQWDHYVPPQSQPDPRILRLNNETQWEEAHEPLHKNIYYQNCFNNSGTSGIGPGMPFANALLKRVPEIGSIGLVPCAVGGTQISLWARGSCLYNRLLTRARASVRDGGEIRGILWYQGESDTTEKGLSDMYQERLIKFFNDVRADLMIPSLPIIQVALASPKNEFLNKIRSVQLKLELPNVTCVDAKGLKLNGDDLHLTTESQVKLGSKMARAFVKYYYQNNITF